MSSRPLEDTMNQLFQDIIPVSMAQNRRLARACSAMILAENVSLSKMANRLSSPSQKVGRVRFLERLLQAEFLSQELVYQPFLVHFLAKRRDKTWYLLIDRSTLHAYDTEILVISLSYYSHAIPLVWEIIDFGCTGAVEQIALLKRLVNLLPHISPPDTQIIFQGDTEFGSVAVIQFLRQYKWDFILAQTANTSYRLPGNDTWHFLADLPVSPRHTVYLERIEWTAQHIYGSFNLFAFYQPHQTSPDSTRRDYRYCLTSLRISHTLRVQGRQRWSIECFFKDCKSGGFDIENSHFRQHDRWERLMIVLALNYLWLTSLGRWLSKVGKRTLVDPKARRQLSYFRIGWDWLLSVFSQGGVIPLISTLYS
jgi:hypothetical protein